MAGFLGRLFGKKPKPTSPGLDFIKGELLICDSSNVASAQYHPGNNSMMIEYRWGRAYIYSPISEAMAASFATAGSKGKWVWDHLRIRGPGGDSHAAPGIHVTRIR